MTCIFLYLFNFSCFSSQLTQVAISTTARNWTYRKQKYRMSFRWYSNSGSFFCPSGSLFVRISCFTNYVTRASGIVMSTKVSWKAHRLTKIASWNVTRWGLFFNIVSLMVHTLFTSVLPCLVPIGKKSRADMTSSYEFFSLWTFPP